MRKWIFSHRPNKKPSAPDRRLYFPTVTPVIVLCDLPKLLIKVFHSDRLRLSVGGAALWISKSQNVAIQSHSFTIKRTRSGASLALCAPE